VLLPATQPTADAPVAWASAAEPGSPRARQEQQEEEIWSLEEDAHVLSPVDVYKEQGRRHMRQLSIFTFKRWWAWG
jgi:hypothetical protein